MRQNRDRLPELYVLKNSVRKRRVHRSLPFKMALDLVNGIRIVESKKLLLSTSDSIEEIATKSGFNSLRTFDREFRAQIKMTPSEYRAQSSRE